jgi:hypothetical protein
MTALPSTERRDVPDMDSREWIAHHDAIYADPRVADVNGSTDYVGECSTDNGQTWQPRLTFGPWGYVHGYVVEGDVMHALLTGHDVVSDGAARIVRKEGGSLVRWTLRVVGLPEEFRWT